MRETGPDAANNSIFYLQGLYYQRPVWDVADNIHLSGRLSFPMGQAPIPQPPTAPLPAPNNSFGPGANDIFIDHVVYFGLSIDNNPVGGGAAPAIPAKSATVTFITRYFINPQKNLWHWCLPNNNALNTPGMAA